MFSSSNQRERSGRLRFLSYVAALAGFGLLVACAGPDLRIKRNAALFATLSTEQQSLIREGKIGIGFSQDMVRLALGEPDQLWLRTDADGQMDIWSYTSYDGYNGLPLFRGEYHRYAGGFPLYADSLFYHQAKVREVFKVSFKDGRVTAIEQEARR